MLHLFCIDYLFLSMCLLFITPSSAYVIVYNYLFFNHISICRVFFTSSSFFFLILIPPYFPLNSIATNLHTCKSERACKPTILLDLTIELKRIFFFSLTFASSPQSLQFQRRIIVVIFRSNYQLAIARDSIALTLTRTCLS